LNDQEAIQAAMKVQRLHESDDFAWLMEDLRELQIASFVKSEVGDADSREEAHAMLRCLSKVETRMKALRDQGNRARRNKDEQERV